MPPALARLGNRLAGWQIVHQSGEGQLQDTTRRYRDAGVDALVVAYIDEMASIMFESDLVVCRRCRHHACRVGTGRRSGDPGSISARRRLSTWQTRKCLQQAGAAMIIDETDLIVDSFDAELANISNRSSATRRCGTKMAARMRTFACPDAAANVTHAIYRILCGSSARLAA